MFPLSQLRHSNFGKPVHRHDMGPDPTPVCSQPPKQADTWLNKKPLFCDVLNLSYLRLPWSPPSFPSLPSQKLTSLPQLRLRRVSAVIRDGPGTAFRHSEYYTTTMSPAFQQQTEVISASLLNWGT